MSKRIEFTDDGKKYVLEYSLKTAALAERNGLNLGLLDSNPGTQIPILVNGAFQKNHRGMTRKQTDAIYATITHKNDFITALVDMYAEAVNALVDTDEDANEEKNANWTLT